MYSKSSSNRIKVHLTANNCNLNQLIAQTLTQINIKLFLINKYINKQNKINLMIIC